MVNIQELSDTLDNFENWISQALADTAQSAKLLEQNSEESAREVDTLAQGVAMNAVVIMRAKKLMEQSDTMSPDQLISRLKALDKERKDAKMTIEEKKQCSAYADFAGQFCEAQDDDEVVCAKEGVPTHDPMTTMTLNFSDDGQRWPVALNCKHVYNWTTLITKKTNGSWVLEKCVKPGCTTGCAPKTLKERQALKEDAKVKHALQKSRARGRVSMEDAVMLQDD